MEWEQNHKTPLKIVDATSASIAAGQTMWSHDPYASPDSQNARIAAISKQFIDMFYKELLKKNCRVATGVEIESTFVFGGKSKTFGQEKVIDYLNSQIVKPDETGTKRNGVYRAYNDGGIVEVTTWPQKPLETIAHVRGIKKLLLESTEEFAALAPNKKRSLSAQRLHAAVPSMKMRFGQATPGCEGGQIEGEHLNISLHHTGSDCKSDAFDLAKDNITDNNKLHYRQLLAEVMNKYTRADAILLLHSPQSCARAERLFNWYSQPDCELAGENRERGFFIDNGMEMDEKAAHRVEWRRPDSGSDIHLAMLTAMSAIYAMVKATNTYYGTTTLPRNKLELDTKPILTRMSRELKIPEMVKKTSEGRIAQFEQSSLVLKMMTEIVEETVEPGKQAEYLAMISEFKDAVISQSRHQFAAPSARHTEKSAIR